MKTCFLACPIGDENSEIRFRADFIKEKVVESTINQFVDDDIQIIRADEISSDGKNVMNKIIEIIFKCDFMVIDSTDDNPNVFLEMGIGMGLNKPMIFLRSKNQCTSRKIPYDLLHMVFVKVPNSMGEYNGNYTLMETDLRSAQERLFHSLEAILNNSYTPPYGILESRILENSSFNDETKLIDENTKLKATISELELMISESSGVKKLAKFYINNLNTDDSPDDVRDIMLKAFHIATQLESELDEKELALQLYEKLLSHDNKNIPVLYNMARAHFYLGKISNDRLESSWHLKSAIGYLSRALKIRPNFERASGLLDTIKKYTHE